MRNVVLSVISLTMVVVTALAVFFAPLDDVLINFHWTIPLTFVIVGLILITVAELSDR